MLDLRRVVFLGVALLAALECPAGPSPEPSASGSPFPVALTSPGALTSAEGKKLIAEYKRALSTELKALSHRQSAEMAELKVAQKARYQEWDAKETEARHKFFAEHTKGAERRVFVQDYKARRDSLFKIQKDERDQRLSEQKARYEALLADQALKLKEFSESVAQGRRPSPDLWPNGGR